MADLRKEYERAELHRGDLEEHPIRQFEKWFNQSLDAQVFEPSAAALATADRRGRPSVRFVLLKGVDERGFRFYTNYDSQKGRELAENPRAALAIYWAPLERQVRVRGQVTKLAREEAEIYFRSRPKGSRLATWASRQSQVIASRQILEDEFARLQNRYPGEEVPMPPYWGGYLLMPIEIEFWQGRSNRLHDRFRYTRQPDQTWRIERLAP